MNETRFHIRHAGNTRVRVELSNILSTRGLVQTSHRELADVILVHRATDELSKSQRSDLLLGGGVYLEYTGGRSSWLKLGDRWFFGALGELFTRVQAVCCGADLQSLLKPFSAQAHFVLPDTLAALSAYCELVLAHVDGGKSLDQTRRVLSRDFRDKFFRLGTNNLDLHELARGEWAVWAGSSNPKELEALVRVVVCPDLPLSAISLLRKMRNELHLVLCRCSCREAPPAPLSDTQT